MYISSMTRLILVIFAIPYPAFPLRKLCTEQMLVLVRMQLRNYVDTQPMKRFKRYKS